MCVRSHYGTVCPNIRFLWQCFSQTSFSFRSIFEHLFFPEFTPQAIKMIFIPFILSFRTTDMWLGLYDKEPTGPDFVHYWQYDCSPLGKYAPWLTLIEPDGKGRENCVRITNNGVFKTRPCDSTLAVICQENTGLFRYNVRFSNTACKLLTVS